MRSLVSRRQCAAVRWTVQSHKITNHVISDSVKNFARVSLYRVLILKGFDDVHGLRTQLRNRYRGAR